MKKILNDGSTIYVGTYGPLKDEWRYKGIWIDASHAPTRVKGTGSPTT